MLQPSFPEAPLESIQRGVERTKSIKRLVQYFPELVPGIPCFPTFAQESEIIRKHASRHDSATSSLFAYGSASDLGLGSREARTKPKQVPIIAVAGGPSGDAVRLIRLKKEQIGWESNKSVRLTNFILEDQEQGWWSTNGSPIQQICFAETDGTARARLAVRYHGAVSVLEPLLHAVAVPAKSFYDPQMRRARYSEARLDANPILTLTTARTGGSPHADVSFNPWRVAQFAIIDQQGHWTIWELNPSTQLRDRASGVVGPSGFVSDEPIDGAESNKERNNGDGWGSIIWAGDRSTIVVANRTTLSVFSIDDDIRRLHVPKLLVAKRAERILDLKRSPLNLAHVILLTSSRVFWLHITPGDHTGGEEILEPGATILLSWVHFRDHHDASLRLDVLEDDDSAFLRVTAKRGLG